jgi:hypothetical protein
MKTFTSGFLLLLAAVLCMVPKNVQSFELTEFEDVDTQHRLMQDNQTECDPNATDCEGSPDEAGDIDAEDSGASFVMSSSFSIAVGTMGVIAAAMN